MHIADLTATITLLAKIADEARDVVRTVCQQNATGTDVCWQCEARSYCPVADLARLCCMGDGVMRDERAE